MHHVISLYDFTGESVKPWAKLGYKCFCYDIAHKQSPLAVIGQTLGPADFEAFPNGGIIFYIHADLHDPATLRAIERRHKGQAAFMSAFPVCTDLAVSGARHFESKRKANPNFQETAAIHAIFCGILGDNLNCPYYIENPVSVLSTIWRKPDHTYQPFEYGGYIPTSESEHPSFPDYIPPRDSYSKKTCLWTGGGFKMPKRKPVECESFGKSQAYKKLGGKSAKTKTIRSATPRGFANAVCQFNQPNPAIIAA